MNENTIIGNETFNLTLTVTVTCKHDLGPLLNLITAMRMSGHVIGLHDITGTAVELNPGYTLEVTNFPKTVGQSSSNSLNLVLQFPVGSPDGSYSIVCEPGTDGMTLFKIGSFWQNITCPWSTDSGGDTVQLTVTTGDANGDGKVNVLDITQVCREILRLDPVTPNSDANLDGNINVLDMTKIARIILGMDLSIEKGYQYLQHNLNPGLNLIYESPDDPNLVLHQTYWLSNDNLLASYALQYYDPVLSAELMTSIEQYGYRHDNYIEIISGNRTTEPTHALDINPTIVQQNDLYIIKTEKVTATVMADYDQYLDKLCYESLWEVYGGNLQEANGLYNQVLNMWDGRGFADETFITENGYATYKLAVFYYTAKALGKLDNLTIKDTILSLL